MAAMSSLSRIMSLSVRKPRSPRNSRRRQPDLNPQCEHLEIKIAPATLTWTGAGGNALWSTVGNWSIDSGNVRTPAAGDSLVFPTVANDVSTDDLATGLSLGAIQITGSGYTFSSQSGNTVSLTGQLSYSPGSGTSLYSIPTTAFSTEVVSGTLQVDGDLDSPLARSIRGPRSPERGPSEW